VNSVVPGGAGNSGALAYPVGAHA